MSNTTPVTEELKTGLSDASLTREHRYASRPDGVAGDLVVTRTDRGPGFKVYWSARTVRGWGKRYEASFRTEVEARAFAAKKWPVVLRWVTDRAAEENTGGAAALFSAQVATLRR